MTATDSHPGIERGCSAPGDGPSSPCRPLAPGGGAAGRTRAVKNRASIAVSARALSRAAARIARPLTRPLASRKTRVALATVFAAFAADRGLEVDEELVTAILSVGVALILGIAHEDAGRAAAHRGESDPWKPTRGN